MALLTHGAAYERRCHRRSGGGALRTMAPLTNGTAHYGTAAQAAAGAFLLTACQDGGNATCPLAGCPFLCPPPLPPPAPHRSQHLFDSIPRYLMFYPFQRLLAVSHTEGQPFVEGEMWWQAWPW